MERESDFRPRGIWNKRLDLAAVGIFGLSVVLGCNKNQANGVVIESNNEPPVATAQRVKEQLTITPTITTTRFPETPVPDKKDGDSEKGPINPTQIPTEANPVITSAVVVQRPLPNPTPAPVPVTVLPALTPTAEATKVPEVNRGWLNKELTQTIFLRINEERRKNGLAELKINVMLTTSEEKYVKLLFETLQWGHTIDGTPRERAAREGYNGFVGEILAGEPAVSGRPVTWDFVTQWMRSPPHRALILQPNYTEIGPACFQGPNRRDLPGKPSGVDDVICAASLGALGR